MKAKRTHQSRRSGFTLIELLVVLAILVLLMSLVGPRIFASRDKANINTAKTQIGMFHESLKTYNLDMNSYPETEQGLLSLVESTSEEGESSKWNGPYITKSSIPKDPWGNDYQYEFPPTQGKEMDVPNIWSFGPDEEDGTEDDIASWTKEEDELDDTTTTTSAN